MVIILVGVKWTFQEKYYFEKSKVGFFLTSLVIHLLFCNHGEYFSMHVEQHMYHIN